MKGDKSLEYLGEKTLQQIDCSLLLIISSKINTILNQ